MILPPSPHHSCFSPFLCSQTSWKPVGIPIPELATYPLPHPLTCPASYQHLGASSAHLLQVSFLPCHLLWMTSFLHAISHWGLCGSACLAPLLPSSLSPISLFWGHQRRERVSSSWYVPPHHTYTHMHTLCSPPPAPRQTALHPRPTTVAADPGN